MKRLFGAIDRFWRAAAPAERLAAFRLLVGGYALVYLVARAPHLLSYAGLDPERFRPVGVATLLPTPLLPHVVVAQVGIAIVLGATFVMGVRHRILAPAFAATLLWVLTYSNSWGKILHTDNLLVLHVGVLALAPAADAWSLDARAGRTAPGDGRRYGWALRLSATLTTLGYCLAGVAKLRGAGLAFLHGDTLRNYVAFDNVRKLELGSAAGPLGELLLPYTSVFAVLAAASLLLELFAPIAVVGGRIALLWCSVTWAFHVGVLLLMGIAFVYPLTGIAFAPFFRIERLVSCLGRRLVRARAADP